MSKARRIIWVADSSDSTWKTGGERYNERVKQYLQQNGWNVITPDIDENVIFQNIFLRHLISNWNLTISLFTIVKPGDILVENSYWHSRLLFPNILLKYFKRVRIVVISHHLVYHDLRGRTLQKLDKLLEGFFFYLADIIISVSNSTREEIVKLKIPSDKIIIIPNGFDRPPETISRSNDPQQLHCLFVGTCYERKGVEYLLAAFRDLRRNDVVLDLAGDLNNDSKYSNRMIKLAKEWDIQDRVIFHGRIPESKLWELYANADIFVLPSLWEGFGVVLLEAMAFGLPVIATDVGAIPDIVVDGYSGILIPPRDSKSLTDALQRLVEDPLKRKSLGEGGRSKMKHSLTWDEVGAKFDVMLKENSKLA